MIWTEVGVFAAFIVSNLIAYNFGRGVGWKQSGDYYRALNRKFPR